MVEGIDKPIYLLCRNKISGAQFWYVIEESRFGYHNDLPEENQNQIESKMNLTDLGSIEQINCSKRDRIRAFSLPALSRLVITRIVVLNTRLYLIGGCGFKDDNDIGSMIQFCDLKLPNEDWQNAGTSLPFRAVYETAVGFKNGSVLVHHNLLTLESDSLLLNSLSSFDMSKKLPKPSYKDCLDFDNAYFLAHTASQGFWAVQNLKDVSHYLIGFDFDKWEWQFIKSLDSDFVWFRGVVMFDSYLFLYGSPKEEWGKVLLSCFDIDSRRFCYCIVECEEFLPPIGLDECHLFQVSDNKLAFLWSLQSHDPKGNDVIYCTKLIITHEECSDDPDIQFRAKLFSKGQWVISGTMIDCTTQVTVREEHEENLSKRKSGEECHMIVEQGDRRRKVGYSVFLLGSSLAAMYLLKKALV